MNQRQPVSAERRVLPVEEFRGVIFDLDGVITDTASIHFEAWKEVFDEMLQAREGEDFEPFTAEDYREYVDGKPRFDGIESFLGARDIELPWGDEDTEAGVETIYGIGKAKNDRYLERLGEAELQVYEPSVELIRELRERNIPVAVVSSSKNCKRVLEQAGIEELFDARVDGVDIAENEELRGKPDPDMFLEAARRLGVDPHRSVVFEDAEAGVEAGRAGGFGLVVGVARSEEAKRTLVEHGADFAVSAMDEIEVVDSKGRRADVEELPDARFYIEHIGASEVAVFVGFDACLFWEDGEGGAKVSESTCSILERIAGLCTVTIVSGRDVAELRERVALDNVVYAGNHGFDIVAPDGRRIDPHPGDDFLPDLAMASEALRRQIGSMEGVEILKRRFCICIRVAEGEDVDASQVRSRIDSVLAENPELRRFYRGGLHHIVPDVDWHEGRAIEQVLEALDLDRPGIRPLYIGDTSTGGRPFRFLAERGATIRVGERADTDSLAAFALEGNRQVQDFLARLADHIEQVVSASGWTLRYDEYDPDREGVREALCTLGNGYFATRGAAPESEADAIHYPGTYLAGGYDRLATHRAGRTVENEDLVNLPNWLPLEFRTSDEDWFDLEDVDIIDFDQILDIRRGLLHRHVRFRDKQGRTTRIGQDRLVHMDEPHLAGLKTTVEAEDWSGRLGVRSVLDGSVVNDNVGGYEGLRKKHFEVLDTDVLDGETALLRVRTLQSRREVVQVARTRLYRGDERAEVDRREVRDAEGRVGHHFEAGVTEGETLEVEKIVAMYSSRDRAISECGESAKRHLERTPRFDEILPSHIRCWNHIWRRFDIGLATSGDSSETELSGENPAAILRLHVFHLVQTASPNTRELDTGIPARGWHGESYRGHIFWDELFIFPLLNLRSPEVTRALLLYRYRRLDEARARARECGCQGALYPWQSGSDGREETPLAHYQPKTEDWRPELTWLQRHINAAVAYNVWHYYQVTGDEEFLDSYGGEIILEAARFYASFAEYNEKLDRYEIDGVVGPDEYHIQYPGADSPGLRNNAYTNVMAVWVICRALEILDLLPRQRTNELCERIGLKHREVERMRDISRKMRVIFFGDGIISQFEGYQALPEFEWEKYRDTHGELYGIDGILQREGDSTNNYKISKQADVLMLFYLLSVDELERLFERLGYDFDPSMIPKNIDYYLERTSHGSSLSRIVHSWVAAKHQPDRAWDLFLDAVLTDVADIKGGSTPEGIHLGAMAGTVDIVERSFMGIETRGDTLYFNPHLPDEIDRLSLTIRYRGHSLAIRLKSRELRIVTADSNAPPIEIAVQGDRFEIGAYESRTIDLAAAP